MGLARSKSMHKDALEGQNDGLQPEHEASKPYAGIGALTGNAACSFSRCVPDRSTPTAAVQAFPGAVRAFHGQPFLSRVDRVSKPRVPRSGP